MRISIDELRKKLMNEQNITLEYALETYRDKCIMHAQYNMMDNARRFVYDNRLHEECTLQIYDILCDTEFD